MKFILTVCFVLASLTALEAQTPDRASSAQRDATKKLRDAQETARKGKVGDLAYLFEVIGEGVAADPSCAQQGNLCSAKEAAADLLMTWIEKWDCQEVANHSATDRNRILELRAKLEALGAGAYTTTAKLTQAGREAAKRRQDAIDKLERCRALIRGVTSIWIASVAPDVPGYEREHWVVNCGATPYGRWTIMRTEGPAAAVHEILGGVLDLKENGRGEYSLNGIGKSDKRGPYKETGWAELTEIPGAPGTYFLTLRGTWSDRVADGRGGWVAKNVKFGDITFQVERKTQPCPVDQTKQ